MVCGVEGAMARVSDSRSKEPGLNHVLPCRTLGNLIHSTLFLATQLKE